MEKSKVCSMCGKAGSEYRCACKAVFFCSVACQRSMWPQHKPSCTVHLIKMMEAKKREVGPECESIADGLYQIGRIYFERGHHVDSEISFKEALRIYQKLGHDEGHESMRKTYNYLGLVFLQVGRYAEALSLYQTRLEIDRRILGHKHLEVASLLSSIGTAYQMQAADLHQPDDYHKAVEYHIQSLEIQTAALGGEHQDVALSLANIGTVFSQSGGFDLALEMLEKALAIFRDASPGKRTENVAKTLVNIGGVYVARGMPDEALVKYEEALVIFQDIFGELHPSIASTLSSIAGIQAGKGNIDEAIEIHNKVLKIRRHAFGNQHAFVARSIQAIAILYMEQGKTIEALKMQEEALKILTFTIGSEHWKVANTHRSISGCKAMLGDMQGAVASLREAHRIFSKRDIYRKETEQVEEALVQLEVEALASV